MLRKQKLLTEQLKRTVFVLTIDFNYFPLQQNFFFELLTHLDLKRLQTPVLVCFASLNVFSLNLLSQVFNLAPQRLNDPGIVLYVEINIQNISLHDGLNLLRAICVFKRVTSVFEGSPSWADVSDHHCSAIASKTVFQQSSQLAVSVRYMLLWIPAFLLITKRIDAVAK